MGELVTGNYFQQLGVRAQLGRTLLPSDESRSRPASGRRPERQLWRRYFDGDPDIVGKTIRLNAYPLTVVGVAAPSFHGTIVSFDVEVFIPLMMAPQIGNGRSRDPRTILSDRAGQLPDRAGPSQAGDDACRRAAQLAGAVGAAASRCRSRRAGHQLAVVPIWRSPFGAQTYLLPAVVVLSVMGALLLLIVCANVAGLVLARGVSRRGEVALRLALGASRRGIVRLLLVEKFVLAVPGALVAVVLAPQILRLLMTATVTAAPMRVFFNLSVDSLVMGFPCWRRSPAPWSSDCFQHSGTRASTCYR